MSSSSNRRGGSASRRVGPRSGSPSTSHFSTHLAAEPARTPAERLDVTPSPGTDLPLSDVKILDFMWVMAGPAATRVLADYGATVVRIESANKVETARTIQPFLNDEGGADNTGLYQNMNAGKLGLTLDLTKPESRDVIFDLVRWADVVCESFSPRAMREWGLGYDELRQVKPEIIMTSTNLFGQNGPLSSLAGFGTMGAAMSGFYDMTGWGDRHPAGCFGAYTDYVSPRFLSTAILAALDHRNRTGEGQYIDLSQAETSIGFLTPALYDHEINGAAHLPPGNSHPSMVPHGIYPAAGDDAWTAIACQDDDRWRALSVIVGAPDDLARLDTAGRRARKDDIDAIIGAWTAQRNSPEIEELLQSAGIAVHTAHDADSVITDPQLTARGHFVNAAHATHGTMYVEGSRFKLSRTPAVITDAGPTYGQHTFEVLEGVLGYDSDRIADLAVAGVLE